MGIEAVSGNLLFGWSCGYNKRHHPNQRAYPLLDIQIFVSDLFEFWGWVEALSKL